MRCFAAIELDDALRRPLVRLLRERLGRSKGVRWCTEEQLHVTLKFLGEVADERVPQVGETIRQAASRIDPFDIRLTELGCFPSPRSPRVLWCGVDDPANGCARWLAAADPLLAELGFERETRAFTPHVTLGRSKSREGGAALRRVLEEVAWSADAQMTVRQVILLESRLQHSGAQYFPIASAPLGVH